MCKLHFKKKTYFQPQPLLFAIITHSILQEATNKFEGENYCKKKLLRTSTW